MPECKTCGGEIAFFTEGGVRKPIAISCTCSGRSNVQHENECRPAECPRCGASVFFVRHNGGSVWLDDLGPPWPIHSCFAHEESTYVPADLAAFSGIIGFCTGWCYRSEYDLTAYFIAPLTQKRNDRHRICFGLRGRDRVVIHEGDLVCVFRTERFVYSQRSGVISLVEFLVACRHCGTALRPSDLAPHESGHS